VYANFVEIAAGILVNDVHSRLNPTLVAEVRTPRNVRELQQAIRHAADCGLCISICGGRHAMGGQQFGTDTLLIDMSAMNRTLGFDAQAGLIEIEAGADWPTVIKATHAAQPGQHKRWGIRQKQTGADALTIGGSVSANIHGRGLSMRPFVDDIEALTIVTADARIVTCSRRRQPELFSLVVGGYGLFGFVAGVTLRLAPRRKLRRLVDILDIDEAIPTARRRASQGCLYGDFQYAIDASDDAFLRRGVCACYMPVSDGIPTSDCCADLLTDDWVRLLKLAHTDKRRAFEEYSAHYLSTHGRVYWSDTMQLSTYLPTYDRFVKETGKVCCDESLMIGELFVPPHRLTDFLLQARKILRRTGAEDIYGTIRSVMRDQTSFLRWARQDFACVIFNLRTPHEDAGVARSAETFRKLHDAAIALDGSFYLTYHRFATRRQIEACYPQFPEFLRLKRQYDPRESFTSDWYRHYAEMFA
jgi:FAD/FMN-containing dehydrogenase